MDIHNNQNNLPSYILMLASLFVLIFFSKDILLNIYANISQKSELQQEFEQVRESREHFADLKKRLESGSGSANADLQRYAREFSQDDFIDFIYSYIETSNTGTSRAVVKSIDFSEPVSNELGFTQVDVGLELKVSNIPTMINILDFLVSDKAGYKIFITQFSYPRVSSDESFSVDIPLSIFYK